MTKIEKFKYNNYIPRIMILDRRNFLRLVGGAIATAIPGGLPAQQAADSITGPLPSLVNKLPNNPTCAPLDLMILFDNTGSMEPYISEAKVKGTQILDVINKTYPGTRFSIATVADSPRAGGSAGDQPYARLIDFTFNRTDAANAIRKISLANGGDTPEAYPLALRMASNEQWRPNAYRIVVLIADSVARDEKVLAEGARNSNFKLVTLMAQEPNIPYWKKYSVDALPLAAKSNLEGMLLRSVMVGCGDYPDVRFETAKYNLDPKDRQELDKLVDSIRTRNKTAQGYRLGIKVEGHADNLGTDVANHLLAIRRARAVSSYLSSKGITSAAVEYGEERPLCRENTEECMATNRRAHLYPIVIPNGTPNMPHYLREKSNRRPTDDTFTFAGIEGDYAIYSFVPTSRRHTASGIAREFNFTNSRIGSVFATVRLNDIYADADLSRVARSIRLSQPVYVKASFKGR